MSPPKLFISYSWSSTEHEQWIISLATELRESGVDVILDKWDLKEGHDAVAFMEKMVTDQDVKKVVMVCDAKYVAKADGRSGGVGTETQIISREVYEKQDQEKFVAVVAEKDDHGKPYLPTYYKSRIYIDLSEPDKYVENFEQLLRWVFDKPLYIKPEIGPRPAFLDEEPAVSLGTAASFRRAIDAIKSQRSYAHGALNEYLTTLVQNLERFRISGQEVEFDDAVLKSIDEFLPYRNEAIQIFTAIANFSAGSDAASQLHRFFEALIPYLTRPSNVSQWREWDFDNFRFVVHELFLYALGALIRAERFDEAALLLGQRYYVGGSSEYGRDVMVDFTVFRQYMPSLKHRNDRMKLRRLSLRADLLKQRSSGSGIEFRYLMQADFVAFMRAEVQGKDDFDRWWPETLLYLGHFHGAFEVFARSSSRIYFEKAKVLLGIDSPRDLEPTMESYRTGKRRLPRWEFEGFDPASLLGLAELASGP